MSLEKATPVLVVDRFPPLLNTLVELLEGLSDEEWRRPVHGGEWTVKDLAQHLLGDEINILSSLRDGFSEGYVSIDSWEELVAWINRHNEEWVTATRRMSPRLICELLRWSGERVNALYPTLDLYAAGGPVSWAGPEPAPVWLDVAREYTERWHHQQHIRAAVGKPGCTEAYFLSPVIATFVYALPQTFARENAPEGTCVSLCVSGEAGGEWSVVREAGGWQLYSGRPEHPTAEISLPEDTAWRLFTKGITPAAARQQVRLSGDIRLAEQMLETVSILA